MHHTGSYSGATDNMDHKHEISSDNSSNSITDTNSTNDELSSLNTGIFDDISISSWNNNANTISNNNCSSVLEPIADFVHKFCKYYLPILVCTGSIGNIFSIFVIFKTKLRKSSCNYYLAALAVSDTSFLLISLAIWIDGYFNLDTFYYENLCKLFYYIISWCWFCSSWFVVAFTLERFIVVFDPFKVRTMCTMRRAKVVIIGITIVGCALCIPLWVLFESQDQGEWFKCDFKPDHKDTGRIIREWEVFIVFAVPVILITIFNTWTGYTVWKEIRRDPDQQNSPNRTQLKVTKMLMVVSTVFVCLTLPTCVMHIIFLHEAPQSGNCTSDTVYLQNIFDPLFRTNFGINFVLYCVSGQNFRNEVLNMFRRWSLKLCEDTAAHVTASEYCRANCRGNSSSSRRRQTSSSIELSELQIQI